MDIDYRKEYSQIPSKEITFVKSYVYYDGPVSGTIKYQDKIYFCEYVDELKYEGTTREDRVFAIFDLGKDLLEKLNEYETKSKGDKGLYDEFWDKFYVDNLTSTKLIENAHKVIGWFVGDDDLIYMNYFFK